MPVCQCDESRPRFPELEAVLSEYSLIRGSLITILQKTQDIYGYLSEEVIYHISERTGITPARIYGVATFYTQFNLQPTGKYLILLCEGTACHVNSAPLIAEAISQHLGIDAGQTTVDGLFSLSVVACLGCCSLAPVMMIKGLSGEETYGNLSKEKALAILDEIAARDNQAAASDSQAAASDIQAASRDIQATTSDNQAAAQKDQQAAPERQASR